MKAIWIGPLTDENNFIQNFSNSYDALSYCKNNIVDTIFIDSQLQEINYIDLIKVIKLYNPYLKIIIVSNKKEDAYYAYLYKVASFILKPYTTQDLINELIQLEKLEQKTKRIFIRTFGNFDLFINGHLVIFKYPKAKEFLAILVDHQKGFVSKNEIINILFPNQEINDSLSSYYRNLKNHIKKTMEKYGEKDIIITQKNGCALDPSNIICDFYELLEDKTKQINNYRGVYMKGYEWAKNTELFLNTKIIA